MTPRRTAVIDLVLNPAQQQAVEHPAGPLMVLAGAGSGKTRVLTSRIAHLVRDRGVPPERILAVTFTNRAAQEMRRRVAELLGREPAGLWIGTFHSLSARLLRREASRLGFTSQFTIYDDDDQLSVVKRLLEQGGYAPRAFPPRLIRDLISSAKNKLLTPGELGAGDDRAARVAGEIYQELDRALLAANAMDFDDLLLHPLTLFREHPDRLEFYQRRFQAILVDEFQDTNRAQYLLIRQLAARHRNVCVVGDDDQSIYSWRGADVRNMLDFRADFPDVALIRLEENYRSTKMILDAANAVIAENRERLGKTLFTSRTGGDPVTLVSAADERDEAEWIVREIRARMAEEGYALADVGILYRTNAQSRALEEALRRAGMAYRVLGAVSFYERREVKDLIAYLRLLVNPADDEAFLRIVNVPRRGIGLASLRTLAQAAAAWSKPLLATAAIADRVVDIRPQTKRALTAFAALLDALRQEVAAAPVGMALDRIIAATEYERYLAEEGPGGADRLENVRELLSAAAEWLEEAPPEDGVSPIEQFLQQAALTTSVEQSTGDPSGVTLMTVHTAKGLEFPITFIAGLEDGLFPLSRVLDTPEGAEEERRLAYVAMTRARDRLYVTWARSRRRGGQIMPGAPSRFLNAIPPAVLDTRRTTGLLGADWAMAPGASRWGRVAPDPVYDSQLAPRFVKGERVHHRQFGSGVIRELSGQGRSLKVLVEFEDENVGTKHLLAAYAGLERDAEGA